MEQASLDSTKLRMAAMLLIAVVTVAIYLPGINAPFIYDDQFSVTENTSIRRLWPLSQPLTPIANAPVTGRPLVNLSLALNYWVGGEEPLGYHVANLAIHLVAAMLLLDVVRRTLVSDRFGRSPTEATLLAGVAALLWAVHPLNTEAVNYVTQRTETMMAVLYLGTLWCAIRYWASGRATGWLIGAAVCSAAGMACKEVMVSAPLAVLLYERTFVAESWKTLLRRSWPLYAALAATWVVLLALNIDAPRGSSAGIGMGVPVATWWMTQAKVLLMYLRLVVWPDPLLIHYAVPYESTLAEGLPWVVPVTALFVVSVVGLWKRHPAGYVGVVGFMVLSPTMLVPIVTEVAAERRMYLPLAGIVTIIVIGGAALLKRVKPMLLGGAAVAVLLAVVSAMRVVEYHDPVLLWKQVLARHDDATAMNNLGAVLAEQGAYDEAIPYYEQAIGIKRDYAMAYSNLGVSLVKSGRIEEGIQQYYKALEVNPNFSDAHFNLGVRLLHKGETREAIRHLETALRIAPTNVDANVNLGVAWLTLDEQARAIEALQRAVELNPNHAEAHNNLGVALTRLDRWLDAVEQYRAAVALEPAYLQAWVNLAAAQAQLGRMDEAVAAAQRAHELAVQAGNTELAERLQRLIAPSP